jgi:hypothetical protein
MTGAGFWTGGTTVDVSTTEGTDGVVFITGGTTGVVVSGAGFGVVVMVVSVT